MRGGSTADTVGTSGPRLLTSFVTISAEGAPSFAHFAKGGYDERVRNRV